MDEVDPNEFLEQEEGFKKLKFKRILDDASDKDAQNDDFDEEQIKQIIRMDAKTDLKKDNLM